VLRPAWNETTMTRSIPDAAPAPLAELAAVTDLVQSTTVDGIPTILAPGRGPLITAGLMFRVGWADETLVTRGVTHLVEHLAIFGLGEVAAHHNGTTGETVTLFHITGTETEVVDFLNGLCRSLSDLPVDRMQLEKEVLWTEAVQRGTAWAGPHLERYGANGPGLGFYDELGLFGLDAAAVNDWARTRFTLRNAVLWVIGDRVPKGLDLALPEGERRSIPDWPECVRAKPASFVAVGNETLLHAVVGKPRMVGVFTAVASKMLYRALRLESGQSYTAACDWQPMDVDRVRVVVHADARAESRGVVVHRVFDVLEAIRDGKVDERDLESVKATLDQAYETPDLGAAMTPSMARWLLVGVPIRHPDEIRRDLHEVTVADLAAIARDVLADAVVKVPEGTEGLGARGFVPTDTASTGEVPGVAYQYRAQPESALVIGDTGVSHRVPGRVITVEFEQCVALLKAPDGARRIFGADGWQIHIEPNLLRGVTPEVIARVDGRVPDRVHLPLPPRDPGDIPARPRIPWSVRARTLVPAAVGIAATLTLVALDALGFMTEKRNLGTMLLPLFGAAIGLAVWPRVSAWMQLRDK
jgi:hypothetical protein